VRRFGLISIAASALALALAGCAAPAAPAPAPAAKAPPAAATPRPPSETATPVVAARAPVASARVVVAEHGLVSNAPLYVAYDKGYFGEQGIEVEFTRMQGTAEMMAPLAAGQVDVAVSAPGAQLFNAMGRDIPIRVVADKGSDFRGRGFVALVIRKDLVESGAVKDYADLKGRRFTTASLASANEIDLVRALAKGGLTLQDVELSPMSYPEMVAALAGKSIDGGVIVEPFVTQAVARDVGVRWRGTEEFYAGAMRGVLMYGPRLTTQEPDLGTRFMIAYLRGARDYMDAFEKDLDRERVIASLIEHTAVKDRAVYDKMDPAGINRNGYLDVADLEYQQEYYLKAGHQRTPVELREAVDHSFVDRALAVLGKQ